MCIRPMAGSYHILVGVFITHLAISGYTSSKFRSLTFKLVGVVTNISAGWELAKVLIKFPRNWNK